VSGRPSSDWYHLKLPGTSPTPMIVYVRRMGVLRRSAARALRAIKCPRQGSSPYFSSGLKRSTSSRRHGRALACVFKQAGAAACGEHQPRGVNATPCLDRGNSVMATIASSTPSRTGDGLRTLEDRTFLLLTVAISLAFAWILWPFYGAVLWATILT